MAAHDAPDFLGHPLTEPVPYESFRAGLRFADIARELAAESRAADSRGDRMFWTRRTVLGRMFERKQHLYRDYLRRCERYQALPPMPF